MKKNVFTLMLLLMFLLIVKADVFSQPAPLMPKGNGTVDSPYKISNLQELYWISVRDTVDSISYQERMSAYYVQTANIDASDTENWDDGAGWEPIGYSFYRNFSGVYDGDGYTIEGVFTNRPNTTYVGFFGYIRGDTARVKNLTIADINITGGSSTGGLVGENRYGLIKNIVVTGTVNGGNVVGGLAGDNSGIIENSYSMASVSGNMEVGGLVGADYLVTKTERLKNSYYNYESVLINGESIITYGALNDNQFNTWLENGKSFDIDDLFIFENGYYLINNFEDLENLLIFGQFDDYSFRLTDDIDLSDNQGFFIPLFIGVFDGGGNVIKNLYVHQENNSSIGLFGFVNDSNAVIKNLGVIDVDVTARMSVGGAVGINYGQILNCYTTGKVTVVESQGGGLCGLNLSTGIIANCYSSANVNGNRRVGGLLGDNGSGGSPLNPSPGFVRNSYSTGGVSGDSDVGGLIGYIRNSDGVAKVTNCFWDTETSGIEASAAGEGKTSEEMKRLEPFSSWDFSEQWRIDQSVDNPDNNGYPSLAWQQLNNYLFTPIALEVLEKSETEFTARWREIEVAETYSVQVSFTDDFSELFLEVNDIEGVEVVVPITNDRKLYYYRVIANNGIENSNYSNVIRVISQLFSGGEGTVESPYEIETLADLELISLLPEVWSAHFLQTANIDATDTENWNGGKGWRPIGFNWENYFHGFYNGGGHTISGLYINRPATDNVGLFGYTRSDGEIKNLAVVDVNITGNSYTGVLAGRNQGGSIINSYTSGSVYGGDKVGGMIGGVGEGNYGGSVINCYSTADVTGAERIGGLVGYISGGSIKNSYSRGTVVGTSNTGGLTGSGGSTVINSYWDTETSGQESSSVGEGRLTENMTYISNFVDWDFDEIWNIDESLVNPANNGYPSLAWQQLNHYLRTPIAFEANNKSATEFTANWREVEDAVSYGVQVSLKDDFSDIVFEKSDITDTFADIEVTEISRIYYYRVFAFDGNENSRYSNTVEVITQMFSGGEGSSENPYNIAILADLELFSYLPELWENRHFLQTANIDASETANWNDGEGWWPIGHEFVNAFTGVYDGGGHIIKGLTINRPNVSCMGFFGHARGTNAEIKRLGLVDVDIVGRDYTACIVSRNEAKITECFSSGTVSGTGNDTGGLAGENRGQIIDSYSNVSVFGDRYAGGLTGYNDRGTVINSYSVGTVSGRSYAVGLIGRVMHGTVTDSYWDIEISGTESSAAGEGKTTEEMKQLETFDSWDFDEIWEINSLTNSGYPYLQWQNPVFTMDHEIIDFETVLFKGSARNSFVGDISFYGFYWKTEKSEPEYSEVVVDSSNFDYIQSGIEYGSKIYYQAFAVFNGDTLYGNIDSLDLEIVYEVLFLDWDNQLIAEQDVEHGNNATTPDYPAREGYTFTGWSSEFDSITKDMTIQAEYEINIYTVTFLDEQGDELVTVQVEHGASAELEAPELEEREGFSFRWSHAIEMITENITVQAVYEMNIYTVTFLDWDGQLIEELDVEHGSSVNTPDSPEREGYSFTGWSAELDSITDDMTIQAEYEINLYTVTFLDWDGQLIEEQNVEYGSLITIPEIKDSERYTFIGWSENVPVNMPAINLVLIAEWEENVIDDIKTLTDISITVYTHGKNVIIHSSETDGLIIITDLLGRVVAEQSIINEVTALACESGVYVVAIKCKAQIFMKQVVVF